MNSWKRKRPKPIYKGFDEEYYKSRLEKAVKKYGLPPSAGWIFPFDDNVLENLGYMQPKAAKCWREYLLTAISKLLVSVLDFRTLTILDERWHFGEKNWQFNRNKIIYLVRKVLKGLNYIVIIEFDIYRNKRYTVHYNAPLIREGDFGRLIAPHIHGIIWGPRISPERRAKFAGGIFGAPAIKEVNIYHFGGASLYMIKPPYRGKSIRSAHNRKSARRSWDMLLTLHHLLLTHLGPYSYTDLTFAGGEGRAVLKEAKRLWKKDIREKERQMRARPRGIWINGVEWFGVPAPRRRRK